MQVVICERDGRWAAALRRHWPETLPPIREVRGLALCSQEELRRPENVFAVEATPSSAGELATWLRSLGSGNRSARIIVLSTVALRSWEWLWREAGAVHVVYRRRDMAEVVRMLQRQEHEFPTPPTSPSSELMSMLPWPEDASPT